MQQDFISNFFFLNNRTETAVSNAYPGMEQYSTAEDLERYSVYECVVVVKRAFRRTVVTTNFNNSATFAY